MYGCRERTELSRIKNANVGLVGAWMAAAKNFGICGNQGVLFDFHLRALKSNP